MKCIQNEKTIFKQRHKQTEVEIKSFTFSDHTPGLLLCVSTIWRYIRRQRQLVNNPLPVSILRDDLPNPLPEKYSTTNAGAPFLLLDSDDHDRILLYGTAEKISFLENNTNWIVDGTFNAYL